MHSLVPTPRDFFLEPTDIFFKDFFNTDGFFSSVFDRPKIDYPVDVRETDKGLEIDVAAIGLEKKDIKIEFKDGDVLHISYTKDKKDDTDKDRYVHRGITKKSFALMFKISPKFDIEKANASLDKGLLKVTVPAAPNVKPKQLEIK